MTFPPSNRDTLGSKLADYFNFLRKQDIYRDQYGTDNDFKIIDKVFYKGSPYDQVYATLDYKRKGKKRDGLTYTEICDYNKEIATQPNMINQFVKTDILILACRLILGQNWRIEDIDIYKYLGGNPRPLQSGYRACIVLDGKETGKKLRSEIRVDLQTIIKGLSIVDYMGWEKEYRKKRGRDVLEVLKRRDYLLGRE
jgi:hypothetical protein